MPDKSLYLYSRSEAKRNGELELWRESHIANTACARGIEKAIAEKFDGMYLQADTAKELIDEFGFGRVNWVLANTVQLNMHDGRFRPENKEWAKNFNIFHQKDNEPSFAFSVRSHPEIVNGLINQARQEWDALHLFQSSHCDRKDGVDLLNKLLVLNPDILKDEYKKPEHQLFYTTGGNGCHARGIGRKIYGFFLKDGKETYYQRSDFIGILKDEFLPEWAIRNFQTLNNIIEQQNDGMEMK